MTCDCHAHLIGLPPHDADWPHPTPEARLADYLRVLDANGIDKGVLVQPRASGFDNGLIREALLHEPERLRGVAVVPPDVSPDTLRDLHRDGFRGARLGSKVPATEIATLAPRLAEAGLHLQLLLRTRDLSALRDEIARCPVPVVIDHLAHPDPADGMCGEGVAVLLDLLTTGHVFAKLSAVYRWAGAADWSDARPVMEGVIARHPSRLVWGSDWPFVNWGPPVPDYGELFRFAAQCAGPDAGRTILEHTPRVLYGF